MLRANLQAALQRAASNRQRLWYALYLIFVGFSSFVFERYLARVEDNYVIGDWLINYQGGFVRRGLDGAIAIFIGRETHIPLNWVVLILQSSVFLFFLICVYRLTLNIRWNYLMGAILLSPAGIGFTSVDFSGGLRQRSSALRRASLRDRLSGI